MRYPQTFIEDLRRQADIVRVLSDYVTLKKKGSNWMACCPFHQEKTPSFSVNPSKNIFYCFGCGKGGSVFNFVMEVEGLSFPESVRVVAEKAGVPLPELVDDKRFEVKRKEADEVIQLNAWALEFWERQLSEETAEARAAREYVEGRGHQRRDAAGVPSRLRAEQLGRARDLSQRQGRYDWSDRAERARRQEGAGRLLRPFPRPTHLPRDGRARASRRLRRARDAAGRRAEVSQLARDRRLHQRPTSLRTERRRATRYGARSSRFSSRVISI
jgi:hypothetical protein